MKVPIWDPKNKRLFVADDPGEPKFPWIGILVIVGVLIFFGYLLAPIDHSGIFTFR
jgi:hypothetical protein